MSDEPHNLEQTVEQEMALLRDLPAATPRPECLAQVKAAVVAEAGRLARRRRALWWTGTGLGAAAAVLLAVGWLTFGRHARAILTSDPDTALTEWAAALDESNARLASLLNGGGMYGDVGGDENAELDELFRSLDESLRCFENLESG